MATDLYKSNNNLNEAFKIAAMWYDKKQPFCTLFKKELKIQFSNFM